MTQDVSLTKLEDQIRECFGRVVYSHKTHEKMADRCAKRLSRYKLGQILVTALTSSAALGVVVFDEFWLKLATAGVSFLTLFLSAYMKNFDPGGTAQKHRDAASKLWGVRESYLSLLTDLKTMPTEEARERRDDLQDQLEAIYASSPQTDYNAFLDARSALKYNEELTFDPKEIDCFLPVSHRKKK